MSDKKCDIVLQNKKEPYQECASPSVCSALQAVDSASGQVGCGWGRLPAVSQMGEMLPYSEYESQHCSVECNGEADPGSISLA